MSLLQTLLDRGAEAVGGDLIFRGKSMGKFRNGEFVPSEDGLAEGEIDEAQVKVVTAAKPEKKGRGKKESAPEVQETEVEPVADLSDDPLAGLDLQ